MVFLCVRIQPGQSPKMEAIVNADFDSKKTSELVKYESVQWTQVIIGQNQDSDGTITNDTPFYGRISNLNIWFNLADTHITHWYEGWKYDKPSILKWPQLGSSERFGDVHFVKVTSAERRKFNGLDTLPYYPTALCRLRITRESSTNILRYCTVGYFVQKKTCLIGGLRALRFSICLAFPTLKEMRLRLIKQLDHKYLTSVDSLFVV